MFMVHACAVLREVREPGATVPIRETSHYIGPRPITIDLHCKQQVLPQIVIIGQQSWDSKESCEELYKYWLIMARNSG
jgi:hypothetical protein